MSPGTGIDPVALLIFGATYLLIAGRRLSWLGLDRPAGVFVGAVVAVAAGVLSPAEAIRAIDLSTLLLLFGVMGMGAFLALDGFFEAGGARLVVWAGSPARLLGLIVWAAGGLSALITNDAVCVLGAPLVVSLVQKHKLPPLPFLLALATAANTGSVATLVGNPQNMLCGTLGGLGYREHLLLAGPIALLCLAINHALLLGLFRTELGGATLQPESVPSPIAPRTFGTLGIIAGTACVYALGADLAWTAAGGFTVLMLLHRRDTRGLWPLIDSTVLLFFAGLFVVVEALNRSGAPAWFFVEWPLAGLVEGRLGLGPLAAVFVLGSNVVSNVPFILVIADQVEQLPDPRVGWELLAVTSTIAGNLTVLGSVANIIVAESARELGGLPFWAYARVGVPLTLLSTLVALGWFSLFSG